MNNKSEEIKEKNKILFTQLRNGSKTAEAKLMELNIPLITRYISTRCNLEGLRRCGFDYDDVFSAGEIGLLKAIRAYDAGRRAFSTFATACISNEITNLYKVKSVRAESLDQLVKSKSPRRSLAAFPSFFEKIEDRGVIATVKQIIKVKLSERQEKAVNDYYFLGKTQPQIAQEFNLTQRRISSLLSEAVLTIKETYNQLESGEINITDLQKSAKIQGGNFDGQVGPFMKKMLSSAENIKRLNELIDSTLTEHQAKIIRMRYLSGAVKRQTRVAQELGIKANAVARCDAVSIDKLKRAYKEKYGESSPELEHAHGKMARVQIDPLLQKLMQDEEGMSLVKQTSKDLLTPRQLSVIEGRYFTMPPKTHTKLAKELNLPREMVVYEEKRAVVVLKRKLTEVES